MYCIAESHSLGNLENFQFAHAHCPRFGGLRNFRTPAGLFLASGECLFAVSPLGRRWKNTFFFKGWESFSPVLFELMLIHLWRRSPHDLNTAHQALPPKHCGPFRRISSNRSAVNFNYPEHRTRLHFHCQSEAEEVRNARGGGGGGAVGSDRKKPPTGQCCIHLHGRLTGHQLHYISWPQSSRNPFASTSQLWDASMFHHAWLLPTG